MFSPLELTLITIAMQEPEQYSAPFEQREIQKTHTSDAERMKEIAHQARLSATRRANRGARLHRR